MTHTDLVSLAAKWLRSHGCQTVVTQASVMTMEQPDAIGWNASGFSKLIECKVSRADFLRDAEKPFRKLFGMGYYRYYLTPQNLISLEEIPDNWGLLYVVSGRIRIANEPTAFTEWNRHEELKHLLAEVRRRDGVVKTIRKKGVAS